MADIVKPTLGSLLRALRARKRMTLKEMSTLTGLPFSTLSKVESDRLTLTYDKLQAISERLNIRVSELFAEREQPVRGGANSRRSIGTLDSALTVSTPNMDYSYFSPELRNKRLIPVFMRVKARSLKEFGSLVGHDGEEFAYVLDGAVEVHTEYYDPVTLRSGESVYIDSKMPHAYIVGGGFDEATMICMCSTTQDELLSLTGPRPLAAATDSGRAPRG